MSVQTDGHWPLARKVPELNGRTAICCECGRAPKRIASRGDMLSAWHQVHRCGLNLPRVAYVWTGEMQGLSQGGYE